MACGGWNKNLSLKSFIKRNNINHWEKNKKNTTLNINLLLVSKIQSIDFNPKLSELLTKKTKNHQHKKNLDPNTTLQNHLPTM